MGVDFGANEHVTDVARLRKFAALVLTGRVGAQAVERQTFSVLVEILAALKKK